mmetsp:Transcript_140058/g.390393  ORF Transcript_140058/g.390393 Transcript_140058/m.390393 type:complete len:230 (-) Transcript_140058:1041-1730(-)
MLSAVQLVPIGSHENWPGHLGHLLVPEVAGGVSQLPSLSDPSGLGGKFQDPVVVGFVDRPVRQGAVVWRPGPREASPVRGHGECQPILSPALAQAPRLRKDVRHLAGVRDQRAAGARSRQDGAFVDIAQSLLARVRKQVDEDGGGPAFRQPAGCPAYAAMAESIARWHAAVGHDARPRPPPPAVVAEVLRIFVGRRAVQALQRLDARGAPGRVRPLQKFVQLFLAEVLW